MSNGARQNCRAPFSYPILFGKSACRLVQMRFALATFTLIKSQSQQFDQFKETHTKAHNPRQNHTREEDQQYPPKTPVFFDFHFYFLSSQCIHVTTRFLLQLLYRHFSDLKINRRNSNRLAPCPLGLSKENLNKPSRPFGAS